MKLKENKNIFCSVSSGYSSVLMAVKMREWYPDHKIIYGMANTSKERPESLHFMNECNRHFNLNMDWIEAQFHKKGTGVTYKVVKYKDLKVNGEIFEDGIKKLGLPSKMNKWCNRDMKVSPLKKYADSFFGKNNYSIAVGMRIDELDRVSKDYKNNNVFYPLVDHKISTRERNLFWSDQDIKITIPAYKGNCDLCFEKSNRKLLTIIKQDPNIADWWNAMINKYGQVEMSDKPAYNDLLKENQGMSFYRGFNTIQDLVEMSKFPFKKATDEYIFESDLFDLEGDCGSGCQVF